MAIAKTLRRRTILALSGGVFVFSWFYRFNDPGGSFAGLTDDHFFYLVRGWQILFGDLPVRDFVDHGAPLYYYVGAAVQLLFGRGTLSELAFSSTMLALAAALTFWLATAASGSIAAGLAGTAVQVFLEPRFYNYPKLLAYAAALPLLWRFADQPSGWTRTWIAVATAVAFLFRHDHGAFVGLAMVVLVLAMTRLSWRQRVTHTALYGLTTLALLTPYLAFVQLNGGLTTYLEQASAWADRDRERAPVVWPGLFENPDGVSETARSGSFLTKGVATVQDNIVAWTFYAELALPLVALLVLLRTKDAGRTGWAEAHAKILSVVVLAAALDAYFLRSPLEARLADPSVPLVILIAWLLAVLSRLLASRAALAPAAARTPWVWRGMLLAAALPVLAIFAVGTAKDLPRQLAKASFDSGLDGVLERAQSTARQLRTDWQLRSWLERPDRPSLIDLSLYLAACTRPDDRVFVQAYLPQVTALARRAFAGGHADLRPGFFTTTEAQRLTVARLQAQSVPVILLETEPEFKGFTGSFPLVKAYIDRNYEAAGTHVFDGRFDTTLFVRRDRTPQGTYAALGWPCYADGVVPT